MVALHSGQWTVDSGQPGAGPLAHARGEAKPGPLAHARGSLAYALARFNRGTISLQRPGERLRACVLAFALAALGGALCFAAGFKAGAFTTEHTESTEKGGGFKAGENGKGAKGQRANEKREWRLAAGDSRL